MTKRTATTTTTTRTLVARCITALDFASAFRSSPLQGARVAALRSLASVESMAKGPTTPTNRVAMIRRMPTKKPAHTNSFLARVAIAAALCIIPLSCKSPPSIPDSRPPQTAEVCMVSVPHSATVHFQLFLPREYGLDPARRWPLILFLHGAGERGDDLALVKVHGPPKIAPSLSSRRSARKTKRGPTTPSTDCSITFSRHGRSTSNAST